MGRAAVDAAMAVAKEDIGAEPAMAGGAVGSPVRLRIA
jgi:hypothetical protein